MGALKLDYIHNKLLPFYANHVAIFRNIKYKCVYINKF